MSGIRFDPDGRPHACALPSAPDVLRKHEGTDRPQWGCPGCFAIYQLNPIVQRWFRYYPKPR